MLNATYHELSLIISEMTDNIIQTHSFDSEAFDLLRKNLGLIFDSLDDSTQVSNIRASLGNLLAEALRQSLISKGDYNFKLDAVNQSYYQHEAASKRVNQLYKCLALILNKNTLATQGNIFDTFTIGTLSTLLQLPSRIQTYLQSRELLVHIYNYLLDLHIIYVEGATRMSLQNIQYTLRSLCSLAETAGYLTPEKSALCKQLVLSTESDISEGLAGLLSTMDDDPTTFFQRGGDC